MTTGTSSFVEEVRGDEPKVAAKLRIEEREREAGRGNASANTPSQKIWQPVDAG